MNLRSVITEKPVRSVTNLSLDVCIYTYSSPSLDRESHTVHRCPLILALLVTLGGNVTEVSRHGRVMNRQSDSGERKKTHAWMGFEVYSASLLCD